MGNERERRAAQRMRKQETLSIQLLLPCLDEVCPARVVETVTIDVSEAGMRILLAEAIEADRLFDICIELKDNPKRFLLTGETRWCHFDDALQAYEVGIQIYDGEGTDYDAWSSFLSAGTAG